MLCKTSSKIYKNYFHFNLMDKNTPQDIPEMQLQNNYTPKAPIMQKDNSAVQKEIEKKKKALDKLKNFITKKYKFTQAIGIIPPQAVAKLVEDEMGDNVQKEELEKLQKKQHIYVIIPEDKFKEIPKIKSEIVKEIEKEKLDAWLYLKTPVDIWETCLDSKFDIAEAIAMSFPLYDTGFLGALRVAQIHKSLVLQKFEKYVVSYVIAGSLVRGEAIETSDVDVFVIIDDTDVKRMPRLELKERLRAMIYQYVAESESLAGVRNKLSPQIWLLTDFWEGVKDAQPVYFTSLRDGVPIHDRGTFLPWKALLKMGKLKPSPEAIDMFMSMADRTKETVDRRLMDVAIDLYYGILTPSQALIMLYGAPPPTPKETPKIMKEIFFTKEKMLEVKYINILDKAVKIFKDYEHQRIKTIKGVEADKLLKEFEDYLKRLKELRKEIDKRFREKTIDEIHKDTINLLKAILGNKSQAKLVEEFEKELVKKGKMTQQHLRILNKIMSAKAEVKKGKLDSHKVNEARKDATILINALIEYTQRCELANLDKTKMSISYKEKGKTHLVEIVNANNETFVFEGQKIGKIVKNKIHDSNFNELNEALEKQKEIGSVNINPHIFEVLKKELGDFEIIL